MKNNWKKEYDFIDAFAEIHTTLYAQPEVYEPSSYLAAKLQDRMNIRRYFNKAISKVTKEDHSFL